jgi:hypothetical protein
LTLKSPSETSSSWFKDAHALELAEAMPRIAQEKGDLSTWQAKHKVTKPSSFGFVSVNQSVGFLVETLLVWQRFTASTVYIINKSGGLIFYKVWIQNPKLQNLFLNKNLTQQITRV